jgi:GTPase SAR1 family protein
MERFETIIDSYINASVIVCLCYDLHYSKSFYQLLSKIERLKNTNILDNKYVCVVGTKKDLIYYSLNASADGHRLAQKLNCPYFECSAQDNNGILKIYEWILDYHYNISYPIINTLEVEESRDDRRLCQYCILS